MCINKNTCSHSIFTCRTCKTGRSWGFQNHKGGWKLTGPCCKTTLKKSLHQTYPSCKPTLPVSVHIYPASRGKIAVRRMVSLPVGRDDQFTFRDGILTDPRGKPTLPVSVHLYPASRGKIAVWRMVSIPVGRDGQSTCCDGFLTGMG